MSIAGGALFFFSGLIALLAALATVVFKNPIRAAMGLLAHILALAGLYLSLHAHLLAALQLIVYAGAVVVLFVFVIMLIGPTPTPERDTRGLMSKTLSLCLMVILTALLAFSLLEHRPARVGVAICPPAAGADCSQFGGVVAVSRELFQKAIVPFELVSVLLLVAVVGAVAVARGRSGGERRTRHERAARGRRLEAEAPTPGGS
ncbi:MAG: NADH-quinone oxidoreductase subunit J [Proteobacteria bacterium]|nr:NADH-quinone oxidoreductase subunit J [Pseudomonadota bacterium]